MINNEESLPKVPPDDQGFLTTVRDKKTGKISWAEVLTPEETARLEKKSPLHQPISANPPSTPSKN